MITEIRKTISGTEYWDNEKKRSLFVPTGEEPGFEVTENPGSMILGVDWSSGTDFTAVDGKVLDYEINLDDMNAEELLSFAKENDIEVPAKLKKEETIRNHIVEQVTTDAK
ncbi:Rho termination factor N-terminal domain-containing protein [Bacillus toyonensis]|nr:Rho termination factor N-terminal domain-containing protein [Bacillus toyonensis]